MSNSTPVVTLSPRDFDLVLFDLDGVLTGTARVHAAAWETLFERFLEQRSAATGQSFEPFHIDSDYRRHVDGKPRLEGIRAFLASRGIELPFGTSKDSPGWHSIQALGMLKNEFFLQELESRGVRAYDTSIELVGAVRVHEIKTAVVSSSKNCEAVLRAAGIADSFDTRVDGLDLEQLALKGKPAPDGFLEAARRLGVESERAVVVEDAIAGIEAGRAGRFGLVIGVDRGGQSMGLRRAGADAVVTDLAQVQVAAEPSGAWSLIFEDFDSAQEGAREALCTLGNGYFATRGAAPGTVADGVHYPGTYLAGGYNRLLTHIDGRVVENEDLVNLPNWLALNFRLDGVNLFDEQTVRLLSYRQELDLRRGLLVRKMQFEDRRGQRSRVEERRLVSMSDMHSAALEIALTAENWSGQISVRTAIDGRVTNSGAQLYQRFNNQHLVSLAAEAIHPEAILLVARTNQSNVHVAQAVRTQAFMDGKRLDERREIFRESAYVAQEFVIDIAQGQTLMVEKVDSFYSSRDRAISDAASEAFKAITRADRFASISEDHALAWKHLWRRFDVYIAPSHPHKVNILMLLRLNMLHLLQTVSPHSIGLDIGVPARGWTGEAYQGHVFWDEVFIFPFFNYRMPEITRSLLLYRYRRLPEARAAARAAGYRGAMFPWQSASNGEEVTQAQNLNSRSGRWMADNTHLQRHVGSAVAYNVWQYFQVTEDVEFLELYGAELILDIARFWSSIASFNEQRGRYEIQGVMGPDEFHDAYPGSETPGLSNNAYTNFMAAWVLWRALEVLDLLSNMRRAELAAILDLTPTEIERWEDISRHMFIPLQANGIISQFEGYENLLELDWDAYRGRYENIQRLDLILEAENDTPNRYKLSKQADVLMLFYLFSSEELSAVFSRLDYRFAPEMIPQNVAYYDARTSHGSTLSRVVHAWVLARSDRERSMRYFAEALQSDVNDIQQGTTREGVHLGAMAGTVDLVQRVSTGIEVRNGVLNFNPRLPKEISRLDMRIRYREQSLDLRLRRDTLTVRGGDRGPRTIKLGFRNEVFDFVGGTAQVFHIG